MPFPATVYQPLYSGKMVYHHSERNHAQRSWSVLPVEGNVDPCSDDRVFDWSEHQKV